MITMAPPSPGLDESILDGLHFRIADEGGVIVRPHQLPITAAEWRVIEEAAERAAYTPRDGHVSCLLAPLRVRFEGYKQPCAEICAVIDKPEMRKLFAAAAGNEVEPVDIQLVRMNAGGYLGTHNHERMQPIAVLHLDTPHEGGNYYDVGPDGRERDYDAPAHSLVLCRGDISHGVRPVTSGSRTTLVLGFGSEW
jgi:hypothetical protein